MCGIAGFTRFHQTTGDNNTLLRMGDSIAHRGPDAHGEYINDNVGLCHRRLSILDLSEAGNQPMFSKDGNLTLVFNGEIYNFLELREQLEQEGYHFHSHTDSEVLLALYEKHQEKCLELINGMFAFAIWNEQEKELFIARDRLGKKPLYYFWDKERFIFASEIKAILQAENIHKEVRPDAVYDFFCYQYVPDPKTIFKNIYKLEPGHAMTVNKEGLSTKKYWHLSFITNHDKSQQEHIDTLKDILNDETKKRMISDVPLGAFLSGGVDSSAIVALMAGNSEKPITTCSIGFDSKKYDEVEFAKSVAEQYKTDHHELTVKANVHEHIENIIQYFDEPFADPSSIPTYFVSQLAREKVTVALSGDGGDENFAGYEKYQMDVTENKLRKLFPRFIRVGLFPTLSKVLSKINFGPCKKASSLLYTLSKSPAYGFYLSNAFMHDRTWEFLAKDELKHQLKDYHPSSITEQHYQNCDAEDHFGKILYTDIKTYLTGGVLTKVDRMSMANSLEVRSPILDYKIVEHAAQMPTHLKYNKGEKKFALKQAFSTELNNDILYRKKMGFSVPLATWLRDDIKDLAEKLLLTSEAALYQFFKPSSVELFWHQHQAKTHDHSTVLWSMITFEIWWSTYMKENTNA